MCMIKRKKHLTLGGLLLAGFIVFTLLIKVVDVQPIGPRNTVVGFATLNGRIQKRIGIHLWWYVVTDWLGLLPVAVGLGFATLGAIQLCRRQSLWKVEREILWLGVLYLVMGLCYVLFETDPINYRPILLADSLEPSYPSSHILLSICVMSTTTLQVKRKLREKKLLRRWMTGICWGILVLMVAGRTLSGVHWITDILGGILLAAALVELYRGVTE